MSLQTTNPEIDGIWLPIRAELDGEAAPGMALEKMRMILRAGTYCVQFGGEPSDEGTFTTEIMPEHFVLTLRSVRGINAGREIPALGQLRGDRLRLCYGLNGALPSAFATSLGAFRYLVTYRRETQS